VPHKLFEQACEQSKGLATFDQVQDLLRDHIGIAAGIETLALQDAHGAVLAGDVTAPRPVPTFSNSAIDGYAFAFSSLAETNYQLEITGEIFAGEISKNPLAPGQAVRIFTGAVMPENADTCLMQENATTDKNILTVPTPALRAKTLQLATQWSRVAPALAQPSLGQLQQPVSIKYHATNPCEWRSCPPATRW